MLGQQLGVSRGKMVNVKDIVFNSSHILGRHTVHILPYGYGLYIVHETKLALADVGSFSI